METSRQLASLESHLRSLSASSLSIGSGLSSAASSQASLNSPPRISVPDLAQVAALQQRIDRLINQNGSLGTFGNLPHSNFQQSSNPSSNLPPYRPVPFGFSQPELNRLSPERAPMVEGSMMAVGSSSMMMTAGAADQAPAILAQLQQEYNPLSPQLSAPSQVENFFF